MSAYVMVRYSFYSIHTNSTRSLVYCAFQYDRGVDEIMGSVLNQNVDDNSTAGTTLHD